MPYKNRDQSRRYQRMYKRLRRAGASQTPCQTHVACEFRLRTAEDILRVLEGEIAVVKGDDANALEQSVSSPALRSARLRPATSPRGSKRWKPNYEAVVPNSAKLSAAYKGLSPTQRFHLAVAASARRDERDLVRLRQVGPLHADAARAERVLAFHYVVLAWSLIWEDTYHAWMATCMMEDATRAKLKADGMATPVTDAVRSVLAVYLGLVWFCESIGCDAETSLESIWPPLAARVRAFVDENPFTILDSTSDPDGETRAVLRAAGEVEDMLAVGWRFERDDMPEGENTNMDSNGQGE